MKILIVCPRKDYADRLFAKLKVPGKWVDVFRDTARSLIDTKQIDCVWIFEGLENLTDAIVYTREHGVSVRIWGVADVDTTEVGDSEEPAPTLITKSKPAPPSGKDDDKAFGDRYLDAGERVANILNQILSAIADNWWAYLLLICTVGPGIYWYLDSKKPTQVNPINFGLSKEQQITGILDKYKRLLVEAGADDPVLAIARTNKGDLLAQASFDVIQENRVLASLNDPAIAWFAENSKYTGWHATEVSKIPDGPLKQYLEKYRIGYAATCNFEGGYIAFDWAEAPTIDVNVLGKLLIRACGDVERSL